jgi:hypothetical protein
VALISSEASEVSGQARERQEAPQLTALQQHYGRAPVTRSWTYWLLVIPRFAAARLIISLTSGRILNWTLMLPITGRPRERPDLCAITLIVSKNSLRIHIFGRIYGRIKND